MARTEEQIRLRALRSQHRRILSEYQYIKKRVAEYTEQRFLSPAERMECSVLQRAKLQKKDALFGLQNDLDAAEARNE